ncbi:hypothetical protein PHMEG_00027215 [Phytophthora megakarya]|uniref:Uncharacterized protein n=1 Tax=Phytophthora megakarya TaxID=4795 RepID=A0A225V7Q1_9STRA|nr:hypothetical protein PHMEG_00027215 [Phytophthora megakarya]
MSLTTFEDLLCIVGQYRVVDYYQSLRRSRGVPPLTPAGMLQCVLSWLAGGSYHHVRVITGVSTATFYRVVYRVMFAINDSESRVFLAATVDAAVCPAPRLLMRSS